jgi:DNA uptake protein ComE-like DNA-binding protein
MKKFLTVTLTLAVALVGLSGVAPKFAARAQTTTQATQTATRVNVNTATEQELATIPGIGPKIVKELLEYRPYTSKEQFETELGKYLSADELAALEQNITLGLADLNTATKEELMAVPGIGDKIASEIADYRPYTSWAQFEAELGKYLSPDEVKALEFLVTF